MQRNSSEEESKKKKETLLAVVVNVELRSCSELIKLMCCGIYWSFPVLVPVADRLQTSAIDDGCFSPL